MSKELEYSGGSESNEEEVAPQPKVAVRGKTVSQKKRRANSNDVDEGKESVKKTDVKKKKVAKKTVAAKKVVKKVEEEDSRAESVEVPATPTKKGHGKKKELTEDEKNAIRQKFEEEKKILEGLFLPLVANCEAAGDQKGAETMRQSLKDQIENKRKETGMSKIVETSPETLKSMANDLEESLIPLLEDFVTAKNEEKSSVSALDQVEPSLFTRDDEGNYQRASITDVEKVLRKWKKSEAFTTFREAEKKVKDARSQMNDAREMLRVKYGGSLFYKTEKGLQEVTFPKTLDSFSEFVTNITKAVQTMTAK